MTKMSLTAMERRWPLLKWSYRRMLDEYLDRGLVQRIPDVKGRSRVGRHVVLVNVEAMDAEHAAIRLRGEK